ncbi:MAG: phytanoyl-CoA dioxygenase family protein [Gammaproteobacteria bacterium]|nr:phytanoyl-CoA dioxygenase family protein [Gammaproteobacteria bacterium]
MTEFAEAAEQAMGLGNRGPLKVDAGGRVDEAILDAYWRTGFYIFEGALDAEEMAELKGEFDELVARAPVASGAETDAQGRPAMGDETQRKLFRFVKPLTDPYGATETTGGRYQIRMREPNAPESAPAQVLLQIGGILQFMDSTLRIYGHPGLLAVAEAVNGADFTPFTEVIWFKQARLGAAVSWHQDGTTHWQSPELDRGTHGFNFMVNLYPTSPENALWVVPGTHIGGKADLKAMMADSGSDRLEGAVPMLCNPGDVAMCNRQVVHGSFPNTSATPRATFVFGFHRRSSVAGVQGWAPEPYSDAYIASSSRLIPLAIDARKQRFPEERPYCYQPLADQPIRLDEATRTEVLHNYQQRMIGI